MVLYFITGNKGKFDETKDKLSPIKIEHKDIDLDEIQSLDPKVVIEHKLKKAQKLIDGKIFVEDVSLEIDALGGFPGPLVKWLFVKPGKQGIYDICKSQNKFGAKATATIGYFDGEKIQYFEGIIKGNIVEPSGESGFGWDPIFVPAGLTKRFSEMTIEEKNSLSHRGKVLKKFKKFLEDQK
ncbi:MAG: non-canonical purine NTP pyrophosphatase [archaeon]|jgi:non-canonical purine NTP pyrophosphatase (RdgB/HAM1 family)